MTIPYTHQESSSIITQTLNLLEHKDTPRVLSKEKINDIIKNNIQGSEKKINSLMQLTFEHLNQNNVITCIHPELYLNNCKKPYPQYEEVAQYIQPNAIISLQSILGEYGILNNIPNIVTSIVNSKKNKYNQSFYTVNDNKKFRFYPIDFNDKKLRLKNDELFIKNPYVKKYVPEKAFCDMLLTQTNIPTDIEYELMNDDKIQFIADKMNLNTQLELWKKKKNKAEQDESFQFHNNTRLGF